MFPSDWAFIVYTIYVPVLVSLYILELIVIYRNRRQYISSFYNIFNVMAIVDILACLFGNFIFRLPMYSISNGFYKPMMDESKWLSLVHTFGYFLNALSQILGVLMALNRFTAIFLPEEHDWIWHRCNLIVGIISWLHMALVTIVCTVLETIVYISCSIRLLFFSIARHSMMERNFFIVGFSSLICSLPYLAAMIYLSLPPTYAIDSLCDWRVFVIYQLPWINDFKYLSMAPMLLLTNSSIRSSIKRMFCKRQTPHGTHSLTIIP